MERTGIESVTSGLQSRAEWYDAPRRATTNALNQAGFRRLRPQGPAWLRGQLAAVWGISGERGRGQILELGAGLTAP
jgi:hypothetical protein